MTRKIRVSCIMPVYNQEKYLSEAINSILGQTYQDFELLIISDHGTSDESLEIINSYSDKRIWHIHNNPPLGLVKSLNLGIEKAKGEYVARMDSDDVSLPNRFEKQVKFLDSHPKIGILGSAIIFINSAGRPSRFRYFPHTPNSVKWYLLFNSCSAHPTVMGRKEIFMKLGGYNIEALHAEDYEFWVNALQETQIANLPEVLLQFRIHKESITKKYSKIQRQTKLKIASSAILKTVGYSTPKNLIKAIQQPITINNNTLAIQASKTLIQLKDSFFSIYSLSKGERKEIHIDLLRRLCRIALAYIKRNPAISMTIYLRALTLRLLNIFLFLRIVIEQTVQDYKELLS